MPETDSGSNLTVTVDVCRLRTQNIVNVLSDLKGDVDYNRRTNEKISKILIGNGGVGLVERVNVLAFRNQLIDKGFGVIVSIVSTLITLWVTGVLKI